MPYKTKAGKEVPDFCPSVLGNGMCHRFVHGSCECCVCCPIFKCCSIDCNVVAKCCEPCQVPCKPACDILMKCEELCQANLGGICDFGPEIVFQAAGCELTCGLEPLEKICGVWHVSTDCFPKAAPAIIFPCCYAPPCCPGMGQDEKMEGTTFSAGIPTETHKMALFKCLCAPALSCACCAPYSCAKQHSCGFCMNPIFGGASMPFWFCTETKPCTIEMRTKSVN